MAARAQGRRCAGTSRPPTGRSPTRSAGPARPPRPPSPTTGTCTTSPCPPARARSPGGCSSCATTPGAPATRPPSHSVGRWARRRRCAAGWRVRASSTRSGGATRRPAPNGPPCSLSPTSTGRRCAASTTRAERPASRRCAESPTMRPRAWWPPSGTRRRRSPHSASAPDELPELVGDRTDAAARVRALLPRATRMDELAAEITRLEAARVDVVTERTEVQARQREAPATIARLRAERDDAAAARAAKEGAELRWAAADERVRAQHAGAGGDGVPRERPGRVAGRARGRARPARAMADDP